MRPATSHSSFDTNTGIFPGIFSPIQVVLPSLALIPEISASLLFSDSSDTIRAAKNMAYHAVVIILVDIIVGAIPKQHLLNGGSSIWNLKKCRSTSRESCFITRLPASVVLFLCEGGHSPIRSSCRVSGHFMRQGRFPGVPGLLELSSPNFPSSQPLVLARRIPMLGK